MVVVLAEQDGRARSDLAPSLLAQYMAICTTRELSYPWPSQIYIYKHEHHLHALGCLNRKMPARRLWRPAGKFGGGR